jgi:hypothetical protein
MGTNIINDLAYSISFFILHFLYVSLSLSPSFGLVAILLVPSLLLRIAKDYFVMTQTSFIVMAFHYRHG